GTGHHIDVGLVLRGRLLAQPGPCPRWMRDVLRGVVAPLLVVGTTIRRTNIEGVVRLVVGLQPEGNADEPARALWGVRRRSTGQFHVDDAVRELQILDRRELFDLTLLPFCCV